MNPRQAVLCSLIPLLAACGGVDSIKKEAPSGTLGGKSWSLGKAVVFKSGSDLDINLYPDSSIEDCGYGENADSVFWGMPAEEGARTLKLDLFDLAGSQTVTYYDGSTNYILTDGVVNVAELTGTEVTIGINATDSDNTINGTFTTTLCTQ